MRKRNADEWREYMWWHIIGQAKAITAALPGREIVIIRAEREDDDGQNKDTKRPDT